MAEASSPCPGLPALDAMRPRSAVTLAALCALATLPLWSLQKRPPPATGPPPALVELARAQGRAIVDLRDGLERYRATTERLRGSPPRPVVVPQAPRAPTPPAPPVAAPPPPPAAGITFAHVINPMPAGHGLHADVEVTFASLERAKRYAEARGIRVVQLTAEYAGDARIPRPPSFVATRNLTRHAHGWAELKSSTRLQ